MTNQKEHVTARRGIPYTCRIVLLMALTYYGIINLLFLGMVIFFRRIQHAMQPWFDTENLSKGLLILYSGIGLIILFMCTSGITLFLRQRRGGYYLFLAGAVMLWVSDFFLLEFDWLRYLINTGFIFILGVMHFSGKCYKNKNKNDSG